MLFKATVIAVDKLATQGFGAAHSNAVTDLALCGAEPMLLLISR